MSAHADDFAAAAASLLQSHSPAEGNGRSGNGPSRCQQPSLALSALELIEELVVSRRVRIGVGASVGVHSCLQGGEGCQTEGLRG